MIENSEGICAHRANPLSPPTGEGSFSPNLTAFSHPWSCYSMASGGGDGVFTHLFRPQPVLTVFAGCREGRCRQVMATYHWGRNRWNKSNRTMAVGGWRLGVQTLRNSLVAQTVKRLSTMRETGFDPQVGKMPWRREWQSTPVLLPGESHGQRSLVGYSPWRRKESDTTERLHFLSF